MDKKTVKEIYKQRNVTGGIYSITNIQNGWYLFNFAQDIKAKQNAFSFMVASGTCFDNRALKDWGAFGSGVFKFEVLETLDKKKDQTQEEFTADLMALAQLWDEKLDSKKRY